MILIIDFDGTMHPMNRMNGFFSCRDRFEACMRDYPAVQILVAAAYRTDHSLAQIRSLFSPDIAERIIDVTPNRYIEVGNEPYQRQCEIEQYMHEEGREQDAWIALDDAHWLFVPRCPNLIVVDPDTGFSEKEEIALRHRLQTYRVLQETA